MAFTVEYSSLLGDEDVKKTAAKLHMTFLSLPFMSFNQILKIVITNVDTAEVYANNGNKYYFRKSTDHNDRLEQENSERL